MNESPHLVTRRLLLKTLGGLGIGSLSFQRAVAAQVPSEGVVTAEMIAQAEWVAGIELSEQERESVAESIQGTLEAGRQLRSHPVDADTVPAVVFRPDFFFAAAAIPPGGRRAAAKLQVAWSVSDDVRRQNYSDEDLAFASVTQQASLLAKKHLSSRELTELYVRRLKRFDAGLRCVVTLLEEHALELADASDRRRAARGSLGILDGIPWVAKDLIAVPPWKTTWGAAPFKEQVRESTATVATRLSEAGAVLLAKVSLGALAWGDQWYEATTRNPWNTEEGSSGSSAGSAAAVAAGLATFALGSETLGSIISPTRRCRTCGLRPTFGRVSRAGCMPLAWSMDKIGPIARHVEDLAQIFPHLLGEDGRDPSVVEAAYQWPPAAQLGDLRVGVTGHRFSASEAEALEVLKGAGAQVVEVDLESDLPVNAMSFILGTEATTVFDDAFRGDRHADYGLWPPTFRAAQWTPAVQYLRANRLRGQLITETERRLAAVDVVLGGDDLLLTNLTGHPSLNVACGSELVRGRSLPGIVKLTAAAYREAALLQVGAALQLRLPPTPSRPPLL